METPKCAGCQRPPNNSTAIATVSLHQPGTRRPRSPGSTRGYDLALVSI